MLTLDAIVKHCYLYLEIKKGKKIKSVARLKCQKYLKLDSGFWTHAGK